MNKEVMISPLRQGSRFGGIRRTRPSSQAIRRWLQRLEQLPQAFLGLRKPSQRRHLLPSTDQTMEPVEVVRHSAWALSGGTAIDNPLKHA